MARQILTLARICCFSVASFLVVSCSDFVDDGPTSPALGQRETRTVQDVLGHTAKIPTVRAVDVRIEAAGVLRPNSPIHIVATAIGHRPISDVSLQLKLLDDDQLTRPVTTSTTHTLERWSGPVAVGSGRTLSGTVVFQRPGYYRVQVTAKAVLPAMRSNADTVVITTAAETLWLLIEERGGRTTEGFDASVVDSVRIPLFGSYGPFVPRVWTIPSERNRTRGPSSETGSVTDVWMDGWMEYYDADTENYERITGAFVDARCLDGDLDPIGYYTTRTNESGAYAVQCPSGTEFMDGDITFQDSYSDSRGPGGTPAGGHFEGVNQSEGVVVRAGNDYAAKAFLTIRAYAPVAFSRFGYSRGVIDVWVSPSNSGYGVYYCHVAVSPQCDQADVIYTNHTAVFGEWGAFATMHEYGHGFHYVALEPWYTYSCADSAHYWAVPDHLSCAFVEGFADFFSMWVAGSLIVDYPFGGDPDLESNPYRTTGNGVRIESTIAAFLYDLVDGANEPDSPSNAANGDEAFDSISYSANWIAKAVKYCSLNGGPSQLDGADQLVYCLEGDTSARTESQRWYNNWRSYSGVSYDQAIGTPAGSGPQVRKFWKYNMYGVLEQ